MTSCSTGRLAGIDSDYAGNTSEVHTEVSCPTDNARETSDMGSITSTSHIFNSNVIDWCSKKQSETYISSYNA